MTVQRRIMVQPQGDDGTLDIAVHIPSPVDERLAQLETRRQGTSFARNKGKEYYDEFARHNREKYSAERKAAGNAFDAHKADNRLVHEAIQHNRRTELKNIEAASRSEQLKNEAIQSLIGTAKTITDAKAAQQREKADQEAKDFTQTLIGSNVTPQKTDELFSHFLDNGQKTKNVDKQKLVDAGWHGADIDALLGKSARELKRIRTYLDIEIGKTVATDLTTHLSANNIKRNDGTTTSFNALRSELITSDTVTEKEARAKLAGAYVNLEKALTDAHPGHKGNEHSKRHLNKWQAEQSKGILKVVRDKIANKVEAQAYQTEFHVPYTLLVNRDGDTEGAIGKVFKNFMEVKPENVTSKDWVQKFDRMIAHGTRLGLVSLDVNEIYRKHKVFSKDKRKDVRFSDQFNTSESEGAYNVRRAELSQEALETDKINRGIEKHRIQKYDKIVADRPNEENTNADFIMDARRALQANQIGLAKHIAGKYISGQGSASDIMEKLTNEDIASMKMNNPGKYTKEWIRGLKNVSESFKQGLLEKFDKEGGAWPPEDSPIGKDIDATLKGMIGQLRQKGMTWGYGKFGVGKAHHTLLSAEAEIENDFRTRVYANLQHSDVLKHEGHDNRWAAAVKMAENQFDKEWENGQNGKGKYAFDTEVLIGKTLPYFSRRSTERWSSPFRYDLTVQGVSEADGDVEGYLSSAEASVIRDKRLEQVAAGKIETPRIIHELSSRWKLDEEQVLEYLYKGYEERTGKPIKRIEVEGNVSTSKKTIKEEVLKVSSAVRYPYDRICQPIVENSIACNNNWMDTSKPTIFNPQLAGLIV